jgi:hypothetical protein
VMTGHACKGVLGTVSLRGTQTTIMPVLPISIMSDVCREDACKTRTDFFER